MADRRIYGLVGHPLGHSFSRCFFNAAFERQGIDAEYRNFDIEDVGMLRRLVENEPRLCGLNVTIPYKEKVMPFLDDLDDTAKSVGAVNVIGITRDGGKISLKGYNTDIIGFADSFCRLLSDKAYAGTALVFGTGGAAKAARRALEVNGIPVHQVSRHAAEGVYTYADLRQPGMIESFHVLVNATPLGTYPVTDRCVDIPYECLTPSHICFDLVYNPALTTFLTKCAAQGCTIKNGLEMLHRQALAAWRIWTGNDL